MTNKLLEMIASLRQERQGIDEAIVTLERLAARTGNKRRGRPPAWMTAHKKAAEANSNPTTHAHKKTGRTFTAAQRKAQAARMKAFWANKKKASAKS